MKDVHDIFLSDKKWVLEHYVLFFFFFLAAPHGLRQRSPTFLAPGTGFVEDNFSTDRVMVWAVMRAVESGRWSFAHSATTHLLLCGPVPNRPRTGTSPQPGGLGPLACRISVPWLGIEPGQWQWKPRILTTRPPGDSLERWLCYECDSNMIPFS